MRVNLGDVNLWFDVSGPSVIPDGAGVLERPTLVAVHGGPGADHINLKDVLAPLAEQVQILSVEIFRRLGGAEAAIAAERDFAGQSAESRAEFRRVCGPLYARPAKTASGCGRPPRRTGRDGGGRRHAWRAAAGSVQRAAAGASRPRRPGARHTAPTRCRCPGCR
jgi:hypothetical protein